MKVDAGRMGSRESVPGRIRELDVTLPAALRGLADDAERRAYLEELRAA